VTRVIKPKHQTIVSKIQTQGQVPPQINPTSLVKGTRITPVMVAATPRPAPKVTHVVAPQITNTTNAPNPSSPCAKKSNKPKKRAVRRTVITPEQRNLNGLKRKLIPIFEFQVRVRKPLLTHGVHVPEYQPTVNQTLEGKIPTHGEPVPITLRAGDRVIVTRLNKKGGATVRRVTDKGLTYYLEVSKEEWDSHFKPSYKKDRKGWIRIKKRVCKAHVLLQV